MRPLQTSAFQAIINRREHYHFVLLYDYCVLTADIATNIFAQYSVTCTPFLAAAKRLHSFREFFRTFPT
jgi:hypothetical protein